MPFQTHATWNRSSPGGQCWPYMPYHAIKLPLLMLKSPTVGFIRHRFVICINLSCSPLQDMKRRSSHSVTAGGACIEKLVKLMKWEMGFWQIHLRGSIND